MSVAWTRASGVPASIASAIAPLPGADVDDTRRFDAVEQRQAALDDDLGLRAAARAPACRSSASAGESPSRRARTRAALARRGAARARALPRARRRSAAGRAGCRARSAARPSARARSSSASTARILDPARREILGRPLEDLGERHASSARRCCSDVSASVYSSRSPCSTWSRRCVVSLMRWSVTRFSGKL